ncbi:MAG TPA: ArgE/DapE family deacylase [Candidatus Acidoferrales bacterium]|nr:ArgE/DapE family deacylase [Candidatus Acidoferrales bacterium]
MAGRSSSDALAERIRQTVAHHEAAIREFTAALVALPTENPPGRRYRECARLIARQLKALRLPTQIVRVPSRRLAGADPAGRHRAEPRWCVLSSLGEGQRTLYFHGHYDVVPAAHPRQFHPLVNAGVLAGRGSADMKGGIAAMIYAMAVVRELRLPLDGRIGLVLVPDEETGGAGGSRYLLESGRLGTNGIGMFTPEPTSGVIWNACRGAISMRVTVRGKPAHVGLHFRGVNAFEQAMQVAQVFAALNRRVAARRTRYAISPAAARRSVLLVGGRAAGGTNFNAVPAEFSFTVDRRINPEESLVREKRALLAVIERFRGRGFRIDAQIFQEEPAAGFAPNSPVALAMAQSARTITGRTPAFEMCPGLLEIRFYAQRGVPAFAFGPGRLEVAHGPSESVVLKKVYDFTAIYALAAARILSPNAGG